MLVAKKKWLFTNFYLIFFTFQLGKSVSLQPSGFSSSCSNNSMVDQKKSKDTLSTCDSSSEVSDEGYKSSQGNVTNSGTSPSNGRSTDLSNKSCANSSETSSHEGTFYFLSCSVANSV